MRVKIKVSLWLTAVIVVAAVAYAITRPEKPPHPVSGIVTDIYRNGKGDTVIAVDRNASTSAPHSLFILLRFRTTWGSEFKEDEIAVGSRYTFMIFKPKPLETPTAWAAVKEIKK